MRAHQSLAVRFCWLHEVVWRTLDKHWSVRTCVSPSDDETEPPWRMGTEPHRPRALFSASVVY